MSIREDLAEIVGKGRVLSNEDVLKNYASDASFVPGNVPECVVVPRNAGDIKEIVELANRKSFSLIPCSSKEPHFRGDTVPATPNAVIVDLSEMRSIVRIDKRNKVALIEPGVTFGDLQNAAAKEGLRLVTPLVPRKTKSVTGSLIQREPTIIPKYHWDGEDPMCSLEVVFGSGDIFRTGSGAGPGTLEEQWASGQAQKIAFGPSQTSLGKIIAGSEGTIGIVTWAAVKLELLPTVEKGFCVSSERLDELIDFTYKILWRKLPDICLIVNGTVLLTLFNRSGDDKVQHILDIPPWVLIYSVSGYEHFPEERIEYIEKDIGEIASEAGVEVSEEVGGIASGEIIRLLSKPGDDPYWKLCSGGGCQDIFFLTTLDQTSDFIKAMDAELKKFEYAKERVGVYMQPIRQGTGCHLEFNLMYDRENPAEIEKVRDLFNSASKTFLDMGGFFSRPYGTWADIAYSKCPDTVIASKKVKTIFDPKGVMNPGKLCFRTEG